MPASPVRIPSTGADSSARVVVSIVFTAAFEASFFRNAFVALRAAFTRFLPDAARVGGGRGGVGPGSDTGRFGRRRRGVAPTA